MRIAVLANRVLLTLLAVSTGAVKLVQMPEEMEIFEAAGFPVWAILAFGAIQLAAGLLLVPRRTVRLGAGVLASTFVIATGVLFVNGLVAFGVFSLLFIGMAGVASRYAPEQPTTA